MTKIYILNVYEGESGALRAVSERLGFTTKELAKEYAANNNLKLTDHPINDDDDCYIDVLELDSGKGI